MQSLPRTRPASIGPNRLHFLHRLHGENKDSPQQSDKTPKERGNRQRALEKMRCSILRVIAQNARTQAFCFERLRLHGYVLMLQPPTVVATLPNCTDNLVFESV